VQEIERHYPFGNGLHRFDDFIYTFERETSKYFRSWFRQVDEAEILERRNVSAYD
jgi:hypothetical protein